MRAGEGAPSSACLRRERGWVEAEGALSAWELALACAVPAASPAPPPPVLLPPGPPSAPPAATWLLLVTLKGPAGAAARAVLLGLARPEASGPGWGSTRSGVREARRAAQPCKMEGCCETPCGNRSEMLPRMGCGPHLQQAATGCNPDHPAPACPCLPLPLTCIQDSWSAFHWPSCIPPPFEVGPLPVEAPSP